jgi:CBS domain containing-hemolysin-like protein
MTIHHRHLSTTSGAVAAAASIISGLVGVIAKSASAHGLHRFAVAIHVAREPMLVRIAPIIAGFAVIAGAIAGLLRLYTWSREARAHRSETDSRQ